MTSRVVFCARFAAIVILMVVSPSLLTACGGGGESDAKAPSNEKRAATASAGSWDPCALLSAEEVEAAVGWKPVKIQPNVRGKLGSCRYTGPAGAEFTSATSLPQLVEAGAIPCPTNMSCVELPDFANSNELVQYRRKGYEDFDMGGLTPGIVAIEGVGVPAIEHDLAGLRSVEMAIGDKRLAFVTSWASSEAVRSLAEKVLSRVR